MGRVVFCVNCFGLWYYLGVYRLIVAIKFSVLINKPMVRGSSSCGRKAMMYFRDW